MTIYIITAVACLDQSPTTYKTCGSTCEVVFGGCSTRSTIKESTYCGVVNIDLNFGPIQTVKRTFRFSKIT